MLAEVPLDEKVVERLRAVLRQEDVVLAYLFGSVARGDAGPLSDVDIAVLFGRDLSRGEAWDAMLRLGSEVSIALDQEADVVVLEIAPPTLRFAVIDEGLVFLNDDEDRRVNFEVRAIAEYQDTQHIRDIRRPYLHEFLRGGRVDAARRGN
ncbi:MAG: type VII toxin-antitoxin system MntA family adenylyltransferase antitoxin [Anaerolineae bacterium]